MENTDHAQRVSQAVRRLESAISSAPIEELRAAIEEDLGLNKDVDLGLLNDSLENLKERASLGHRESLETLVDLGNDIAFFLARAGRLEDEANSPSSLEASSEIEVAKEGCRESIDDCVLTLLKLLGKEQDCSKSLIDHLPEFLPRVPHVFPIRTLEGTTQDPDTLGEVTYLCDGLVQRRLDEECNRVLHNLSSQSLAWPLFISAVDYQKRKSLADCAQNLELGKDIAPNLGTTPRGRDTPTALVRPLFFGLDQLRRVPRTSQELEDMKLGEERNEPAPLDQLIMEAREGMASRSGSWNLENLWMRKASLLPPLQGNAEVINLWVDAAFSFLASMYDGNLEDQDWVPSIMRRIKNKEGLDGGLRQFLREGFETLAGVDRKK